jgi:hypothetical protein
MTDSAERPRPAFPPMAASRYAILDPWPEGTARVVPLRPLLEGGDPEPPHVPVPVPQPPPSPYPVPKPDPYPSPYPTPATTPDR